MALQPPSQPYHWTFRRVMWATLVLVFIALGFWLLYRFSQVVFIFFTAIVIGTVIRPVVAWLYSRGVLRIAGVILVYFLLLALLISFVLLFFPLLIEQGTTIAAALAFGMGWLALQDRFLWGRIDFSFLNSPWESDITLFEPVGVLLAIVSLLLVNRIVVPVAEEWLWPGLILPHLIASFGFLPELLITSVLFSLKHVIIDTSFGRLLTLTGFGIVMGVTATRYGWRASAMAHAPANTTATILGRVVR